MGLGLASDKLIMSESYVSYPYECSLSEQRLGNPTFAHENPILGMVEYWVGKWFNNKIIFDQIRKI